jgi:hypothetical protein
MINFIPVDRENRTNREAIVMACGVNVIAVNAESTNQYNPAGCKQVKQNKHTRASPVRHFAHVLWLHRTRIESPQRPTPRLSLL